MRSEGGGGGWVGGGVGVGGGGEDRGIRVAIRGRRRMCIGDRLSAFEVAGCPTYHTLGNHCLTNLPRAELNKALSIPPTPSGDGGSFYAFVPAAGWRFVVLDSYDVSLLGWPPGHPRHQAAEALLHARNPNEVC